MLKEEHLTKKIIVAYYSVYNRLGFGFLEKVYENALMYELQRDNLYTTRQVKIEVFDLGRRVGEYFADIVVENKVILEIKAAEGLREEHEAQLINYLRATNIEVGLLLNFGQRPEFKRKVFDNERKSVKTR